MTSKVIELPATETFRPDSRDGSKDFQIERTVARELFNSGVIYWDATNGGYMPSPKTGNLLSFRSKYEVRRAK